MNDAFYNVIGATTFCMHFRLRDLPDAPCHPWRDLYVGYLVGLLAVSPLSIYHAS